MNLAYMELVVFQYMLIVFAQLLTVESRIVCRQTKNTKVTKDVETIVTTWTNEQRAPRHHCSPRIQRSTNNHDKNKNNKQRHLHFSYCRPQPPSTTVARTPHPHFTIFVRIGSRFLFFLFFLSYLFFPIFLTSEIEIPGLAYPPYPRYIPLATFSFRPTFNDRQIFPRFSHAPLVRCVLAERLTDREIRRTLTRRVAKFFDEMVGDARLVVRIGEISPVFCFQRCPPWFAFHGSTPCFSHLERTLLALSLV